MSMQTSKRFLGIQAPDDLIAALDAEAAAEGLSRSDVIRRALLRHVRQAPTAAPDLSGVTDTQQAPQPEA